MGFFKEEYKYIPGPSTQDGQNCFSQDKPASLKKRELGILPCLIYGEA